MATNDLEIEPISPASPERWLPCFAFMKRARALSLSFVMMRPAVTWSCFAFDYLFSGFANFAPRETERNNEVRGDIDELVKSRKPIAERDVAAPDVNAFSAYVRLIR